jgi:hypothetical protein
MPQAASLSVRDVASILGRSQGPELFFQQTFTPLASPIIPNPIPLNRPMSHILIAWRGRIVVGGAAYTTVNDENVLNLIQRIRLTGTHRRFGALVPIDITGATAYGFFRMLRRGWGAVTLRAGAVTVPQYVNPYTGDAFDGTVNNFDVEVFYLIPTYPLVNNAQRLTAVPFYYQSQDWSDTLRLQLFFGDRTSLGTPAGATTVDFQQYGGGSGTSPIVSVYAAYELFGPLANSISGAVVIRSEQPSSSPITSVAQGIRLALLEKQKTTNVLIKTGTLQTGTSAGVQVFERLNDRLINRTQIIVDNKPVRNNFDNFATIAYQRSVWDTSPLHSLTQQPNSGYTIFSFDESQNPLTYFRGDLLEGGSTFVVSSDVVTAGANNFATVLQEQVIGEPGVL